MKEKDVYLKSKVSKQEKKIFELREIVVSWPWFESGHSGVALQCANHIEIMDIECGLLSRVSQNIVATKWRIYKGKISSPQDILCKS